MEILRSSSNEFIKNVLNAATAVREKDSTTVASKPVPAPGRRIGVAVNRKPTLGGIFRSSLIDLMNTINSTDVHYIRCIKPNEGKEPWKFEGPMVLNQLRACGVLETVRISCAGYPTRWTYEEFAMRYYMLTHSSEWTIDLREMALAILRKALGDSNSQEGQDKYQLGLTKIFFRAGMLAFLENLRTARLNSAAILIQKNLKAKYCRHRYLEARASILATQCAIRGYLARLRATQQRRDKAATTIQRVWRGYLQRHAYLRIRASVIQFQAITQGRLTRKRMMDERLGKAAVTIQTAWRSYLGKKSWRDYRRKVVIIQSLHRGKEARKVYRTVREEARDLKQISYRLENKVVELTQSLGDLKRDNKTLLAQVESYESQLKSWRNRHTNLEGRARELQVEANQAGITAARLSVLEADMAKLQSTHSDALATIKR
ncbi:Myosin type-2 heavy chain 1, partial [Ascosphaera atra]